MKCWTKEVEKFFNTKWIFITLVGVIGFFSLVQLIVFGIKDEVVVGWFFGDDIKSTSPNAWLGWLIISLGFLGSCITLAGEIYLVRGKRKFIYSVLLGQILMIFYGICIGLWFIVIDYILYCIVGIIHYKHWKDESKKENVMTTKSYLFITIFTLIYLGAALSITMTHPKLDAKPILDPTISALVIFGWFNITRKNKWGYIAFLATDVLGITMFCLLGFWGVAASYIIYIIFDVSGFTIWSNWKSKATNPKKITDKDYQAEKNIS